MFIVGIVWGVSKYRPPVIDNENQYYFITEARGMFSKNKSENKKIKKIAFPFKENADLFL